jgi:tetratricopeptide (TPR) repeat protein
MCVSIRSGLGIAIAATAILGVAFSAPAAAQGACTGNGRISKQIAKQMAAAQDAMKARKWQESLNKMKEAEAVQFSRSAFDNFTIAQFRAYIYSSTRQEADAARELEVELNSPCLPAARRPDVLKNLVGLYTALRNYPKAIEYGNQALRLSKDTEIQVAVAQAYYQSGNNKESARIINDLLADMERGGRRPSEQNLLLARAACERAGDHNCVSRIFEKLVIYYPKPEYWQNLMVALRQADVDDIQAHNVMRLALYVNVLKDPDQFKEMAQLALEEKLACEAENVLQQGFSRKVFVEQRDVDVNKRLLAAAQKQLATEKASMAQNEAAAKSAATGDGLVKVGAQYLACGEAAKAVSLLQAGIAKGGIAKGDPKEAERTDEAYLLLGMAQLKSNNKAEAAKAFRAVKRDPTMVRIAKLWLLNT